MPEKILVIDDELELVRALEVRLKANGYEVEAAYDGLSGVKKAKEIKPDLIILDIRMPKMDGYQACETLISDSATKDIPIIIFTASQQRELESKCRELGVATFIMKPFETNDLLDMINTILKRR